MDLLRAQALKSVEPKTTKKRKSAGSTEDGEIVEEVYKGGKYSTAVFKGVAQPYLSLWELSRELQRRDKAETFQDCRLDLGGELP